MLAMCRAAAGGHLLAREAMPVILFETDSIITEKEVPCLDFGMSPWV